MKKGAVEKMSKEYYQMGWTLDDTYQEDYFCSRDNQRYFIKKNTD